ncbi:uncharacterized protein V1518DRAFT_168480 [Limtongia smithiae]|uniref:uncharacterized protein n=1 Tax=Limtongia smithiae TaxID=1125753 RepID=UPI0034CE4EAB
MFSSACHAVVLCGLTRLFHCGLPWCHSWSDCLLLCTLRFYRLVACQYCRRSYKQLPEDFCHHTTCSPTGKGQIRPAHSTFNSLEQ